MYGAVYTERECKIATAQVHKFPHMGKFMHLILTVRTLKYDTRIKDLKLIIIKRKPKSWTKAFYIRILQSIYLLDAQSRYSEHMSSNNEDISTC